MKKFETELTRLKEQTVQMGELAESMVTGATTDLPKGDPELIRRIRADERRLDVLQVEIDREAIRLVTVYAPVAKDLRFLLMIARINSELERMGDQAVDICEYVEPLPAHDMTPLPPELAQLATLTRDMVRDALRAFEDEDIERARRVIDLDDRVDALYADTFRMLVARANTEPRAVASWMGLILVGRSLERIADHATNVCEEVFYLVKGEDIRHQAEYETPAL